MENKYLLDFISQSDFENHIFKTVNQYFQIIDSISTRNYNKNILDPFKLVFDKFILNKTFQEIVDFEVARQIDKSYNNIIGYFHQNIFKYIKNCQVEFNGWDIFCEINGINYYIELKNKHNTMNSDSSNFSYQKMLKHNLDSKNENVYALVEVIAKKSQNIVWKDQKHQNIRRISIDKIYEILTGDKLSFYKLCQQFILSIKKVNNKETKNIESGSLVIDKMKKIDADLVNALFKVAFKSYPGFD